MHYNNPPLILTDTSITDALGTIELKELPEPQPKCAVRLKGTTPLVERLWRIALSDIEKNVVETPDGCYLGAGKSFGVTVYTRDISYSGILGVNALYPDLMLNSIRFTRKMRLEQSFRVAQGYCVKEIDVPWVEENISEREYLQKYHTNSYTRRTDDVVWMWCAADLIKRQGARQEWAWLFDTGKEFFRRFYQPFFDKRDGLYFGQATFVDIHFTDYKATGYPIEWEIPDCVLIKSLSTNCLYVMGLDAMAVAAAKLGFHAEAQEWETAREQPQRRDSPAFAATRRDVGVFQGATRDTSEAP